MKNQVNKKHAVPGEKEVSQTLKLRARQLAGAEKTIVKDQHLLSVVEFSVAHEAYAIELQFIKEVCPLKQLTPIPGVPSFILGITNIRGQIISIIDLKHFFDLPDKSITSLKQIVILSSADMELGILVDTIIGVKTIPSSALQESVATFTGIRGKYLKGITAQSLVMLDGDKILSDGSLIV